MIAPVPIAQRSEADELAQATIWFSSTDSSFFAGHAPTLDGAFTE